jgi:hypothetical protein
MIAHVAEVGEDRGRVVVRLGAFALTSGAALAAAVHVARAFQSEIEGLFIEDPEVFRAAAHGGVRELSQAGAVRAAFSASSVAHDIGHFAVAAQRAVADAARASGVRFSARVVRDTLGSALTTACAERGPWNIIVFAEPVAGEEEASQLAAVIATVWGTTGYVAAGRAALWRRGPVVIAVEDVERLSGMVRAGQRLAAVAGDDVILIPVGADDIALDWLEGEIRLTLGESAGVRILQRSTDPGSAHQWRASIAGLSPRMVIARHGGLILPAEATAQPLADLRCPVFMVH